MKKTYWLIAGLITSAAQGLKVYDDYIQHDISVQPLAASSTVKIHDSKNAKATEMAMASPHEFVDSEHQLGQLSDLDIEQFAQDLGSSATQQRA